MTTPAVQLSQLGSMRLIGKGGFGEIFALDSFTLSGLRSLAFKRYLKSLPAAESTNLTALIDYRADLGIADRDLLDELFTWPLCLVMDGPVLVGILMRLLGDEWFQTIRSQTGNQHEPRSSSWLLVDSGAAARSAVDVPAPGRSLERLVLCAKLARALALLHRSGLVYGDLNPRNVIFALRPTPSLTLIDCDAVKSQRATGTHRQPHFLGWVPPEGDQAPQTAETDSYKLTLFIIRCLADGRRASLTRDPDRTGTAFDAEGIALLELGIDGDPSRRPTAAQWYGYLRDYLNALTQPPLIRRLQLSERVVLTGTSVEVDWEVQGAESITVRGSDGFEVTENVAGRTGRVSLSITRSGPITVTAMNEFGLSRKHSEPVMVFSAPELRFVNIPEPPISYTGFQTEHGLTQAVIGALQAPRAGAQVSLPELPRVLMVDPMPAVPHLSMAALDLTVAPMLIGLSEVIQALGSLAEAFGQVLRQPVPVSPDLDVLMAATVSPSSQPPNETRTSG